MTKIQSDLIHLWKHSESWKKEREEEWTLLYNSYCQYSKAEIKKYKDYFFGGIIDAYIPPETLLELTPIESEQDYKEFILSEHIVNNNQKFLFYISDIFRLIDQFQENARLSRKGEIALKAIYNTAMNRFTSIESDLVFDEKLVKPEDFVNLFMGSIESDSIEQAEILLWYLPVFVLMVGEYKNTELRELMDWSELFAKCDQLIKSGASSEKEIELAEAILDQKDEILKQWSKNG